MQGIADHHQLLDAIALPAADHPGPGRVALIGRLEQLRRWLDHREADLLGECHRERDDVDAGARDLTQLSQQEAQVSYGVAKRRATRAAWLPELPATAAALETGRIGTEQADHLCALAERLPADDRARLLEAEADLVDDLVDRTPRQAQRRLSEFERSLDADDGRRRLDRQRAANSLRFSKNGDGTTGVHGSVDPISAEELRRAIDAKVTEMWRREGRDRNEMTPPDRVIGNDRRRAEALVELVRAGAAATGVAGATVTVLIDHQTLLGQLAESPVATLGSGEPIPPAEARRLACGAHILPVVLGSPSQPLDVGRTTRLATPAQRAALRAVHPTCCVAGCDVPFDWCEIHHIDWWRLGGRTDFDNLAPLCSKHHHLVHDDGWRLTLDDDRVGHLASARDATDHAPVHPAHQPRRSPRSTPGPTGPAPPAKPIPAAAAVQPADVPMRC